MALRSIEPRELVGCACDGYSQLEAMIDARFGEVEAVAVPIARLLGSREAFDEARKAHVRGISIIAIDGSEEGTAGEADLDVRVSDDGMGNLPILMVRRQSGDAEACWDDLSERCASTGARADRMLVAGAQAGDVLLMERAWLSVALPGADAAVLQIADAQAVAGPGDAVARMLEELAADR